MTFADICLNQDFQDVGIFRMSPNYPADPYNPENPIITPLPSFPGQGQSRPCLVRAGRPRSHLSNRF